LEFRRVLFRSREELAGATRSEQRLGPVWRQPFEALDIAAATDVALMVEIGDRKGQQTRRENGLQFLWVHCSSILRHFQRGVRTWPWIYVIVQHQGCHHSFELFFARRMPDEIRTGPVNQQMSASGPFDRKGLTGRKIRIVI